MRQRPRGKLIWSAIKIKQHLAEELAFLGRKTYASAETGELSDSSSDSAADFCETRVRLRKDVMHVPGFAKTRLYCRVHKQRKATSLRCITCRKAICSSFCWKRYHKRKEYLFDDPQCTGKIVNRRNID